MISGKTTLLPLIGFPTAPFKAPMIYNPWFDQRGIDAIVVPIGVTPGDLRASWQAIFGFTNLRGALITMPHKIAAAQLVDELSTTARIAGACNAVLKRADGTLVGDMFDGTGFTRGLARKGFAFAGASCLIVGAGGVGSAIAASLAAAGVASIALCDANAVASEDLASRLRGHYPDLVVTLASNDPGGYDLVVNATPLGLAGDPMPIDVRRLAARTFVGEVVMKQEMTPLLAAAEARGCRFQIGIDMLYEMIPAYLEFFGFGSATADELRSLAKIVY